PPNRRLQPLLLQLQPGQPVHRIRHQRRPRVPPEHGLVRRPRLPVPLQPKQRLRLPVPRLLRPPRRRHELRRPPKRLEPPLQIPRPEPRLAQRQDGFPRPLLERRVRAALRHFLVQRERLPPLLLLLPRHRAPRQRPVPEPSVHPRQRRHRLERLQRPCVVLQLARRLPEQEGGAGPALAVLRRRRRQRRG